MPQILSPQTPQLDVRVPLPTPVEQPQRHPSQQGTVVRPPQAASAEPGFVRSPVGSVPHTVILPHIAG